MYVINIAIVFNYVCAHLTLIQNGKCPRTDEHLLSDCDLLRCDNHVTQRSCSLCQIAF